MRSWFITGTSSGLGRAIAEAALARGDRVAGTVRTAEAATAFAALAPGRAQPILLDVADHAAARRAIAEVEMAAGGIDVLMNNAGYSLEGCVEASDALEVRAQIDTHFLAPITLIQAALPAMRRRRSGHILNVGSLAAHTTNAGTAVYAGVKAAIETLSVGLAQELAPFGIRVTAVIPGAFRTRIGDARRSAAAALDDYAPADAARRQRLAAMSGRQRGDPVRGAQAVLALVDAADPPVRFALGPDAIDGLRAHAAALLDAADRWEALGSATDLEGSAPGEG